MQSKRFRLDRFLSKQCRLSIKQIRWALCQGECTVDGLVATRADQMIDEFNHIIFRGRCIQNRQAHYLMMHKPAGILSATHDAEQTTVIDLIAHPDKQELHLAGRLDKFSTGLLLLSNDGRWTKALSSPETKIKKRYRVKVQNPLDDTYVHAFQQGMYFDYEQIWTQPAELIILSDFEAEVGLFEGRYHQIKRMFGRFRNPVLALHRIAIGPFELTPQLTEGQIQPMSAAEAWQPLLAFDPELSTRN